MPDSSGGHSHIYIILGATCSQTLFWCTHLTHHPLSRHKHENIQHTHSRTHARFPLSTCSLPHLQAHRTSDTTLVTTHSHTQHTHSHTQHTHSHTQHTHSHTHTSRTRTHLHHHISATSLSHSHSPMHSLTQSVAHSLSHTHTHTHTCSLSRSLSNTPLPTLSDICTLYFPNPYSKAKYACENGRTPAYTLCVHACVCVCVCV